MTPRWGPAAGESLVSGHRGRVSQDIQDSGVPSGVRGRWAGRSGDVKGPACHHRRHDREAARQRGGPQLRRRPVLGLHSAGPLPGRRGCRIRAAVPAAEDLPEHDQLGHGRADRPAAQGTGRAGPGRRAAHHRLAPGTPPQDHGVAGHGQPVPDPGRAGDPGPGQAATIVVPAICCRASQRVLAVRLHSLPARGRH